MKNLLLLFICLIITFTFSFAQNIDKISDIPSIKKGILITKNGEKIKFHNLHIVLDTVIITKKDYKTTKIPSNEVYKISTTGNYIAISAISGGLAGLIGSFLGTLNWYENEDLKNYRATVIICTTVATTLIGVIIGACTPKDKPIYRTSSISLYPIIIQEHNRVYASLGIKIPIK